MKVIPYKEYFVPLFLFLAVLCFAKVDAREVSIDNQSDRNLIVTAVYVKRCHKIDVVRKIPLHSEKSIVRPGTVKLLVITKNCPVKQLVFSFVNVKKRWLTSPVVKLNKVSHDGKKNIFITIKEKKKGLYISYKKRKKR